MYCIKTENFYLGFRPYVYQNYLRAPVNTNLEVEIISYGFSAKTVIEIDIRKLAAFAVHLNRLYESLSGSARLEEPYGEQGYIEFEASARGHVKIEGRLAKYTAEYAQRLQFQNEIDQTNLKNFAQSLLADFTAYME